MSLKGLNLHEQKVARAAKRRAHPGHVKPTKQQKADRQARIEYKRRKEEASQQ